MTEPSDAVRAPADSLDAAVGLTDSGVQAVALLAEPVRRSLYDFVRAAPSAVGRDEAAAAVGVSRALAAFHLDKLVDAGLLVVAPVTASERRMVGRRPKGYRASAARLAVSVPPRHTDLLVDILLDAVEGGGAAGGHTGASTGSPADAAVESARAHGWQRGAALAAQRRLHRPGRERTVHAATAALAGLGFEPVTSPEGTVILRNCPFHPHAGRRPDLVCGINVAFVDGLLRGIGNDAVQARLCPREGMCCVEIVGD
jgi:predicted ArsR family transcriptional regulator